MATLTPRPMGSEFVEVALRAAWTHSHVALVPRVFALTLMLARPEQHGLSEAASRFAVLRKGIQGARDAFTETHVTAAEAVCALLNNSPSRRKGMNIAFIFITKLIFFPYC